MARRSKKDQHVTFTSPLLETDASHGTGSEHSNPNIDDAIDVTRKLLEERGAMAIGHLVHAALDHASVAISHPDQTLEKGMTIYNSKSTVEWIDEAKTMGTNVWDWAKRNSIKVSFMVTGLGISALKSKAIGQYMLCAAGSFCTWSKTKPLFLRFWGFVALMSIRLIVSTLVPPSSPAFGIIIQAATPDEEKWTVMPCFLMASAFAGAWPWIFDKLMSLVTLEDFWFTMGAKRFADNYPLTCWTGPLMREAFQRVYGNGCVGNQKERNGKLGASFAVIVGHVCPFMGAQTTIMQRYFLPHPLDTIISQPFGMTEDLLSMAIAEATSNPVLASWSLTVLIAFFNFARGLIFSGHHSDVQANAESVTRPWVSSSKQINDVGAQRVLNTEGSCIHASDEERDYVALASAVINIMVGAVVGRIVAENISSEAAFCMVAVQMMVQLLIVPVLLRYTGDFVGQHMHDGEPQVQERQGWIHDSWRAEANIPVPASTSGSIEARLPEISQQALTAEALHNSSSSCGSNDGRPSSNGTGTANCSCPYIGGVAGGIPIATPLNSAGISPPAPNSPDFGPQQMAEQPAEQPAATPCMISLGILKPLDGFHPEQQPVGSGIISGRVPQMHAPQQQPTEASGFLAASSTEESFSFAPQKALEAEERQLRESARPDEPAQEFPVWDDLLNPPRVEQPGAFSDRVSSRTSGKCASKLGCGSCCNPSFS